MLGATQTAASFQPQSALPSLSGQQAGREAARGQLKPARRGRPNPVHVRPARVPQPDHQLPAEHGVFLQHRGLKMHSHSVLHGEQACLRGAEQSYKALYPNHTGDSDELHRPDLRQRNEALDITALGGPRASCAFYYCASGGIPSFEAHHRARRAKRLQSVQPKLVVG